VHHAPEDIPGVGRFAVVHDPQGAVFGLLQNTQTAAS
jgi:predicted enzyme related to lactoylglutathione lyase